MGVCYYTIFRLVGCVNLRTVVGICNPNMLYYKDFLIRHSYSFVFNRKIIFGFKK
jgi:hypothetical protein